MGKAYGQVGGGGGREYHDFPSEIFLSRCRKSSLGNPLVLYQFPVSKNFIPMSGIPRISMENSLSHSTENLCGGTLLCLTKFLVSKKMMDKRGVGGREYHDFPSKIFCLTVPKIFVGEPFSVSLFSDIEKFHSYEGNITTIFKSFVVSLPKNFVAEPFCLSKLLVWKNFIDRRGRRREGVSRFSVRKFLSQCRKSSLGNPLVLY